MRAYLDARGKWVAEVTDSSGRARTQGPFNNEAAALAAAANLQRRLGGAAAPSFQPPLAINLLKAEYQAEVRCAGCGVAARHALKVDRSLRAVRQPEGTVLCTANALCSCGHTTETQLTVPADAQWPTLRDAYAADVECPTCKHRNTGAVIRLDPALPITTDPADGHLTGAGGRAACARCSASFAVNLSVEAAAPGPRHAAAAAAAPPPAVNETERDLMDANSDTAELTQEVFSEYQCRSIKFGRDHPSDNITESGSMAGVPLPPASYPLQETLGAKIIEGGLLSNLQLEGALYSCQRHSRYLPVGCHYRCRLSCIPFSR